MIFGTRRRPAATPTRSSPSPSADLILLAVFPLATVYGAFVRNAIYAGTTLEGGHRFSVDDFANETDLDSD